MSIVKEAVYIHFGMKMGIFKPEEVKKLSYIHSKGFFVCLGCGVKIFHKTKGDNQYLLPHLLIIMHITVFIKNDENESL